MTPISKKLRSLYPGLFLSIIIATVSTALSNKYEAPVMLFALLLGLTLNFLHSSNLFQSGIDFSAHTLLRFSVALLGVRIAFKDIVSLGTAPLLIVAGSMVLTIFFSIILTRLLKLPATFGVLSGCSVAVCGVSAAAAVATVLPKKDLEEKFFALTVITITAYGTMAMIIYPVLVHYLGLPDYLAGVFLGGAIHDVAQVVGASYSISEEAGDLATYIKLLRVALLMPIVMGVFLVFKEKGSKIKGNLTSFIPLFLVGFFALALCNNLGLVPESAANIIKQLSKWLLVISIAAIGLKTSLQEIVNVGWRPILLISLESVFIAALILAGIYVFNV